MTQTATRLAPTEEQTATQFTVSEEQGQLADSANRYAADRLPYDKWLARARAGDVFDAQLWQEIADFGWLALGIPDSYGGLGFTVREHAGLMESLGRYLLLEPYWSTAVLCAKIIERAASPEQQERLFSGITTGETRLAFACFEPNSYYDVTRTQCEAKRGATRHGEVAGSEAKRVDAPQTEANRAETGYLLNGKKIAVLDCQPATDLLVLARTSGKAGETNGLSLFRVNPQQAGVSQSSYPTVDSRQCSDLTFVNVSVCEADRLGPEGNAYAAVQFGIDYATVALCAEAIGVMSHLITATIEYLKTRQQFGRPLSDFQVLRHRVVDMYVACEQTRSLTMMAASHIGGEDRTRSQAVAAAKAQVGTAGRFVGESAVQLHGGIGMTDDLPVGHYMKRLMGIDALLGNADFQLRRFAGLTRTSL